MQSPSSFWSSFTLLGRLGQLEGGCCLLCFQASQFTFWNCWSATFALVLELLIWRSLFPYSVFAILGPKFCPQFQHAVSLGTSSLGSAAGISSAQIRYSLACQGSWSTVVIKGLHRIDPDEDFRSFEAAPPR
jgi:hypothetical protein